MRSVTALLVLAGLSARSFAAPIGSPSLPVTPIALAAAPVFAVAADHGINGPRVDNPQILLPGLPDPASAPLTEPGFLPPWLISTIFLVTLAAFGLVLIASHHALHRKPRRIRRYPPQRTMACI